MGSGSNVEARGGGKNVFARSSTRLETQQPRTVWTATSGGHGTCSTGVGRVLYPSHFPGSRCPDVRLGERGASFGDPTSKRGAAPATWHRGGGCCRSLG